MVDSNLMLTIIDYLEEKKTSESVLRLCLLNNPCRAICITGFRIFLHQGAMRGEVGEGGLI